MPRRVPYSAACALIPAGLVAAPTAGPVPCAVQQIVVEQALLRAAVDAALKRDPEDEDTQGTLRARRVGPFAHVLATQPDGRAVSLLFRFDGQAWRRIAKAS
jgi:hypothetical protein